MRKERKEKDGGGGVGGGGVWGVWREQQKKKKKYGLHDAIEISSHQPPESDYEQRRFE